MSPPMPPFIETLPATLRILLVFVLILFVIKRNWDLGHAFLMGAVSLGLIFGMGPLSIARSSLASALLPKTLSLTVVVSLILVLSHSLERTGQMGRLLEAYQGLVRWPTLNLVVFPALIGLLPMPGGAIFSAPMVKTLGRSHAMTSATLSYINYWYRHIWEYWWPLYPGILLTTALADIDLWHLVFFTLPLTLVAVAAGYWPLRGMGLTATHHGHRPVGPLLKELVPIMIVIVGGLSLGEVLFDLLPGGARSLAKEGGLIAALLVGIGWVWHVNHVPAKSRWAIVVQPALLKMIYMVTAILVFKGILEDSGAVALLSREILHWQIPLMAVAVILPFIVGIVAGITIAFVGTTFPILITLVHTLGQGHLMLPYLALALVSGFTGVLLSPLHLCLLLSNAYFETSLLPVYRRMGVPLVMLLGVGCLYFLGLRFFMG
jgi:integral membrane protein (TIGR00529 family)